MWERFSFYGMRAILVLFIADSARGGIGWSQATASRLFGLYGFFAYALPGRRRLHRRPVLGDPPLDGGGRR